MDIIIFAIMSYLFYLLSIKHEISKRVLVIFTIVLILDIILYFLHSSSLLPISL